VLFNMGSVGKQHACGLVSLVQHHLGM